MMENILDTLTINSDRDPLLCCSINYPENHPFSLRTGHVPTYSTGSVYMLVSWRYGNFSYIWETQSFNQRLCNHQSEHGAVGTSRPEDRPFCPAGYITCGDRLEDVHLRLYLESWWRNHRNNLMDDDIFNILAQGE